jgi:cell division protein FtsW (lipid II flippase)
MARRILSLALLIVPAVGLAALGFAIVAAAGRARVPRVSARASHFAVRHAAGALLGAALGWVVARAGIERLLRAAPVLFAGALVATAAVFVPGIGVRAAGASRWLSPRGSVYWRFRRRPPSALRSLDPCCSTCPC